MPVLAWFIFRTLSQRRETPRQLSQGGVRLHVNWVNTEWDSTSTESTQKAPTFTKIFIIPHWLSWHEVSFHVNSVEVETHLALTHLTGSLTSRQLSHRRILKNLNKSAIKEQNRKHSKALLFGLYMFDQCKNQNKKCPASVPFRTQMPNKIENKGRVLDL